MSRCENNISGHTNLFVNLNGIPYVLAEYLDRNTISNIDRSFIKSDIFIDQSESMRAIIDISVDEIGKRGSDGLPAIVGNCTKQKNLIETIERNAENLDHELDVFRRGIILRVNYQLENDRTGNIIRSMTEDLHILDRNYYLDINPRDVDDNAIIVNFNGTQVSTINEFTHGREKMRLRITGIQMFYPLVKKAPKAPRIKNTIRSNTEPYMADLMEVDKDYYNYHSMMQNQHVMGGCDKCNSQSIIPPSWAVFNRFYHFDTAGQDIVLHYQEINDPMTKVGLIPCGTIRVNRVFMINPCHRLIFKFSIWKNDVVAFSNTVKIAQALKAPLYDGCDHVHHDHDCNKPIDLDHEKISREIQSLRHTNMRQDAIIQRMMNMMEDMYSKIIELTPKPEEPPEDPDIPPITIDPPCTSTISSCKCNCVSEHTKFEEELLDIRNEIEEVRHDDEPIPADRLEQLVNDAFDEFIGKE